MESAQQEPVSTLSDLHPVLEFASCTSQQYI